MRDGEIEIKVGIVKRERYNSNIGNIFISKVTHTYIVYTKYFFVYLKSNFACYIIEEKYIFYSDICPLLTFMHIFQN